jgi:CBS domain-containing protein
MKLGQIMTLEVQTVDPRDSVQRAADVMREHDVGLVPVVDQGKILGVVTDRDVALRFVAEALDFSGTTVADIMTRDVACGYEDQDVAEAARVMEDLQLRRLLVVDRHEHLVGVVSLGDLARHRLSVADNVLASVSAAGRGHSPRAEPAPSGGDVARANVLIKDELAAVETYRMAISRATGGTAAELRRLGNEHERAATLLQEKLAERGIEPATRSGLWGGWARLVEGAAALLGEKAAIKVLKEGEEHGIKDYERVLSDSHLAVDLRVLIQNELLPQARAHIPVLDRFLARSPA